jgi:hypothetical protein
MSNPIIPSDINSWSKAQTAEYYIDEFGWTLTPLIEGSKEPKYPKEQQYGVGRNDLLLDLNNGCNIGLFPSGTHVVLDLDSKRDQGKSVQKLLTQAGSRVQSLPRERTAGGVHIHLRIKDIEAVKSKHPKSNKLVNKRVFSKVAGELFFGGTGYVVTSPSLHEAGTHYEWETYGEIPEWSWREFTAAFGDFEPEKSEKRADDATRARKFSCSTCLIRLKKRDRELSIPVAPEPGNMNRGPRTLTVVPKCCCRRQATSLIKPLWRKWPMP